MDTKTSFNTSKLDHMLLIRSSQHENGRKGLLQKLITWLDAHGSQYGIQSAYIFGSLAKPYRFHQDSDIDIAVETINPDDLFAVIGFISEAMERDVDIIELNKCHFSDRIKQTGIRWIAPNSSS